VPAHAVGSSSAPPSPRRGARPLSGETAITDGEPTEAYVDMRYFTGNYEDAHGLGYEAHVLDYTNFDGDDDEKLPGETSLSKSISNEGRRRREKSRRRSRQLSPPRGGAGAGATYPPGSHLTVGNAATLLDSETYMPTPRRSALKLNLKLAPLSEDEAASEPPSRSASPAPAYASNRASSIFSSSDLSSYGGGGGPSRPASPSPRTPMKRAASPSARPSSVYSEVGSLAHLIPYPPRQPHARQGSMRSLMPRVGHGAGGVTIQLELDERELGDMRRVAEFSRAGQPRLDVILQDEVRRARGPVVVACTSLLYVFWRMFVWDDAEW
jgi:hypothetical protein